MGRTAEPSKELPAPVTAQKAVRSTGPAWSNPSNELPVGTEASLLDFPMLQRPETWECTLCNIQCASSAQLQQHLNSLRHQRREEKDAGKEWRFRRPPGGKFGNYELCKE